MSEDIRDIRDIRAISLMHIPHSAYCKVCWQAVYSGWVDRTNHEGACPFGALKIEECKQASDWEQLRGEVRKLLHEDGETGG